MSILEKVLGHVNAHNKILEQNKMWTDKEKRERARKREEEDNRKNKHCKFILKTLERRKSVLVE